MVEVASVDTNPTKLPDVEPIQAGKIDTTTTRCFDLLCVGKYEQGSDLKLDIQSADEIPNLITKSSNGDPVFNEPKPMCTIRAPKGHNVWVKIYLETITTNASDYIALGIKKQCEDEYFDILHTRNSSRYVDVLETDVVELVPLVSSTSLSEKYTAVNPGDIAKITDKATYDFGSVYRVHISLHDSQWITNQTHNITEININNENSHLNNMGKVGIGPVTDQNGIIHENQMYSIRQNGTLLYSPDGKHWFENGTVKQQEEASTNRWVSGLAYGNGVWCAISGNGNYGVRRSVDGGKTWSKTLANIASENLNFSNGIFMTISGGIVYTSPDAEIWSQIGEVDQSNIVIPSSDKWVVGNNSATFWSKDGKIWNYLNDGLYQIEGADGSWWGGCYVNGYFYAIQKYGIIARYSFEKGWEKVFSFSATTQYQNITCYKNKLFTFGATNSKYVVGLFRPDGTIDEL